MVRSQPERLVARMLVVALDDHDGALLRRALGHLAVVVRRDLVLVAELQKVGLSLDPRDDGLGKVHDSRRVGALQPRPLDKAARALVPHEREGAALGFLNVNFEPECSVSVH